MMQRYEKYKDSGVDWIGEIPESWFQETFYSVFSLKSIVNNKNEELLSVYLDKGVIRFSDVGEKRTNVTSEDLSKYQLVEEGDFVLNNQQAWRGSVGVSFYRGIVSPAYIVLAVKNNFDFRFLNYLLRNRSFVTHYLLCSKGVGTIQRNLYWPQLKRVYLIFPLLEEQRTIAMFLDDKTAKIDKTIALKEKEIELLKERRQIIIQKAVTKGLDDTVKLKDSGVDWIGEIPEHWEIIPNKYIFKQKKVLVGKKSADYDLLSLTLRGIIKRDMENPEGKFPAEFDTYQEVKKGDFVFCLFDVEETPRTVGLSNFDGMITGAYTVMTVNSIIKKKYLYYYYLSIDEKKKLKYLYKGLRNTIPKDSFFSLKTILPSDEEQSQIVSQLEEIEEKIAKAIKLKEQEIEKLKEYKTVLIDNVVTGKMRVN